MGIENAKKLLLEFMQEMYEWEKKATKNLRSLDYENTLRLELALIFSQYCTPKKIREREKYHFPFVSHLNINQKHTRLLI
ncbi:NTF2 fold immunity protein [Pasteurella sp. PK-2025]|uniref:NTF2 fold immunity protein n=1 Tax=Pasteurella sp. PK-2025 TaxID=3413133 RepID=UPI003C751670